MSSLLPQPFWFRVAHSCRRVQTMPRLRGRLLDLSDDHLLMDLGELSGQPGWVKARAGWNDKGLGFEFEMLGKASKSRPTSIHPLAADSVQIWIDTRDTRTVHRATRYCHKFRAAVTAASDRTLTVAVAQEPIGRASSSPSFIGGALVRSQVEPTDTGWRLELFFPADALAGYDPEANRRLGLAYQVTDPFRGTIYSGVGHEFPVGEDPSLWATLTLEDPT